MGTGVVGTGVVDPGDGRARCPWAVGAPEYLAYHDEEWGRPVRDERRIFEKLCLEGFQSGLSWLTILRKRENFRLAFCGFDPAVVAGYGPAEVARLLGDAGIVRHRGKIEATVANARAVVALREGGGDLVEVCWRHAPVPAPSPPRTLEELPAVTPESTALSRELRRLGFRFVGPTTVYAAMQALGLVDDHLQGCHVRAAVEAARG